MKSLLTFSVLLSSLSLLVFMSCQNLQRRPPQAGTSVSKGATVKAPKKGGKGGEETENPFLSPEQLFQQGLPTTQTPAPMPSEGGLQGGQHDWQNSNNRPQPFTDLQVPQNPNNPNEYTGDASDRETYTGEEDTSPPPQGLPTITPTNPSAHP